MCLTSYSKFVPFVTEKNILVYKEVCAQNIFNCISYLQEHIYVRFKTQPTVTIKPELRSSYMPYEINEGYHSTIYPVSYINSLFIIPKGALVYSGGINARNNIIDGYTSNTIIYIGKNTWYNKLIAKIFYQCV